MKKGLIIFLVYLIISVLYTFPLILKMNQSIYGYAGDNLGAIHYFWWWKYATVNHLDVRNSYLEQAPFGYHLDSEPGSVLYYWPLKILTLLTNATLAYNLVLLLGFATAAWAMYSLIKSVVESVWISFWAGFVYSFSPYHFWKAYNHLDLTLLWGPPLALFFFFRLIGDLRKQQAPWRHSLLLGLVTAATVLTNLYYGYFLLLTLAFLFLFVLLFFRLNFFAVLKAGLLTLVISLVFSLPFLLPTIKDAIVEKGADQSLTRQASFRRPLLDVVSLSARPWDYLIPSSDNPWLGWISDRFYPWVRTKGSDFKVVSGPVHERTIFLGFVSLFLMLVNLYLLIFSRDFRQRQKPLSLSLWLTVFSLFLISLPPYIFVKSRTIDLPSFWLYQILPTFRAYSRLGIFVLMLVVFLASLTLKYLSRNWLGRKWLVVFLTLMLLSAFEFTNVPPAKVEALNLPKGFRFLSQKRESFNFIVYPKEFNVAELLIFQPEMQAGFNKGFLNFHSQSPYYKLWDDLSDFSNPKTIQLLAGLGIRYAVFQKKLVFANPNPVDDLWYTRALGHDPGVLNPWFKLAADFDDSAVYEIVAPADALIVINGSRLDTFPQKIWLWPQGEGKLYLRNVGGVGERVGVFLLNSTGNGVSTIRFNDRTIKEKGGGFYLDDLKSENFLSLESGVKRSVSFSRLEAFLIK